MREKSTIWKKIWPMSSDGLECDFNQLDERIKHILEIVELLESKVDDISQTNKEQEKNYSHVKKLDEDVTVIKTTLTEVVKRLGESNSNLNGRFKQLYDHISNKSGNASSDRLISLCGDIKKSIKTENKDLIKTVAKTMKRNSIEHLDYHLTEHCNLNCVGCSTFAPIANKKFAELEAFERDIKRLYELVGDSVQQIHLLGGEPLLHPHVEQFAKSCRLVFKKARIDITTNGLLIFDMPDSFWSVLCENNISIKYTQYPVKFEYEKMVEYIKSKGVYVFSAGGKEAIKFFRRIPLNAKGTFNMYNSFIQCPYTDCVQLKDGKLFHCPASGFSDLLNLRMKEDEMIDGEFVLSEGDYADLSMAESKNQIFEFLSNAIPFCRYCDMNHINENVEWKTSAHNIKEWVDV